MEETVGYNRDFVAKKNTKIATITIGHADGLSRKLGNGNGSVTILNPVSYTHLTLPTILLV